MLYTTKESLASHLGIIGHDEDDALTELIATATELIDTDLGDNLEITTKVRRIDGSGSNRIVMENRINSVVYVKDARSGYIYTVDFIDGYIIYLNNSLDRGVKNIEISYVIGYEAVPNDFEKYFLEYCKELYTQSKIINDNEVVKTKKLGDLSVTFFSPSELMNNGESILSSHMMEKILSKYKHFSINII